MHRFLVIAVFLIFNAALAAAQTGKLADLIQAGERVEALEVLAAGADVNEAQPDQTTPLHWAVYRVDHELVEALLERGADPNAINRFGATPLGEAVKVAHPELVEMLLVAGADANASNEDGQTALMLASQGGALETAELLIEHGGDVNAVEQWRGQTALMWAAAENHPEVAGLLIANGADVGVRAMWTDWPTQITSEPRNQYRLTGGLTPLLYAARSGCQRCVEAMLDRGADIQLPTPDGVTPLIVAIDNAHFDMALYLIDQGANPNVWDWWGRTALYVAADMNGDGGGGRRDGGASGSLALDLGVPGQVAPRATGLDVASALIEAGVDVNPQLNMHRPGRGGGNGRFQDDLLNTGATPLLRAAIDADTEMIRLLLDQGAEVDLPNAMGVTPFLAASGVGNRGGGPGLRAIAAMDLLLEAGADVNARVTDTSSYTGRIARRSSMSDRQGQTALFNAAQSGRIEIVRYLLDHGARVDVADDMGRTPLDAALGDGGGRESEGSEEVAELLRSAGAISGESNLDQP